MPPASPAKPVADKTLMLPITNYINYFDASLSPQVHKFVFQQFHELHLKKGDVLHRSGVICQNLYFVIKGVLRGYIIDNNKEVTTWITSENQLVSSIRSVFLQIATEENMDALEDCHLLVMAYSDLQKIYDTHPEFNVAGRRIMEFYYTFAESRAFICRLSKATDRYNLFMEHNGHLINRIPLMYIASYLNMSIETVSRIRRQLRTKKD
jgi:CRP-like cAMP-binding protein